jgi:hypothetical protein
MALFKNRDIFGFPLIIASAQLIITSQSPNKRLADVNSVIDPIRISQPGAEECTIPALTAFRQTAIVSMSRRSTIRPTTQDPIWPAAPVIATFN